MSPAPEPQAAPAVLMLRPAAFAANPETASSNRFQQPLSAPGADIPARARVEHEALAVALERHAITVHRFDGQNDKALPDEVFVNNWVSFHADGTAVLYPMMAPSRRLERRHDILDRLKHDLGYRIDRIVDLTRFERDGRFLEGTGSLVLDRVNRVAYACLSARTSQAALEAFSRELSYELVTFHAVDRDGEPIYHTNVMMSIGSQFAVLCPASIRDAGERKAVLAKLLATGRQLIELDYGQLHAFAANLLELEGSAGPVIALSSRALASLEDTQRETLAAYGRLVPCDVGTLETVGGGSVRCMLAEIHLPLHQNVLLA